MLLVMIILGTIMVVVADKKGFNGILWFMAAGLLGLIILACLPSAKKVGISDADVASRKSTGNLVGGILSGISILLCAIIVAVSAI